MISRPEPFSHASSITDKRHFRYRQDELFRGNEKILEQLPSREGTELYLTSSPGGAVHFLKIRTELQQDAQAVRELRKLKTEIPDLTGLIPIRSCGALDDGACFILSDFQDVPSYAKMISMLAPLPQNSALALIYSVILILARAWQNNLFHGFLKPTKILYYPKNGNYITEMGLSAWRERFYPDLVHRPGQWYAAPETTAGKSVWQSDQYALGIMLFQMLTGVLPFRSDAPNELARMHREQTMPLPQERNSQIQTLPAVDAIILRMTMKDPAERYPSWEKLLADLEKANLLFRKKEKKQ
jgi:serine/threonine-protein kinase